MSETEFTEAPANNDQQQLPDTTPDVEVNVDNTDSPDESDDGENDENDENDEDENDTSSE